MMIQEPQGKIITFYSYKGGTGRTMALANVACLLARRHTHSQKKGVLMIDWDLEAPGLHYFFHDRMQTRFGRTKNWELALDQEPGLIDLFIEIEQTMNLSTDHDEEQDEESAMQMINGLEPDRFILETDIPHLYLLKAGLFDAEYPTRVSNFEWEELYNRSPWLFSAFAARLARDFRFVLIDSRTGLTDTSGICTMLMPEKLVVVFTPNRQSYMGLPDLVRRATDYRRHSDDLRPLSVFPLVARIDISEKELRELWRFGDTGQGVLGYQPQIEELLKEVYDLSGCNLTSYFDQVQIQHASHHAYGEEIAVLVERSAERLSLARSYEAFTDRLIDAVGPWDDPRKPDLVKMRADYLRSLRMRFEYLDLGGIAPRVQNRTVKLRMEDIVVSVLARSELDRSKLLDISALMRRSRTVLLGDPGCGKSTLLRYIAYTLTREKVRSLQHSTPKYLPVLVRLVQFSQAQAADPTLSLDTYIRKILEPRWSPLFQHALDTGEALVLLDGLDEIVDSHQRSIIAEAIQKLAANYPLNSFIVTSRIVSYQTIRLGGDFAHYIVQPLSSRQIGEFVLKWYMAIEREAGGTESSQEIRNQAEGLVRAIEKQPGIHKLAENPMLLTIIALVNWRGRKLPNRRVELYAYTAETLIESWPYQRSGVRFESERVSYLLSPVAYRIVAKHPSGYIVKGELLTIFAETFTRLDATETRQAKDFASLFLDQLSQHSGIFREVGYDEQGRQMFSFLHFTFAEYFAGRYMAGSWEGMGDDADKRRAFLRLHVHIPRWHEVVLLMAGDVGLRDGDRAERATRLLSDILTLESDYEAQLHRDLVLAGECLADDLRITSQASGWMLDHLIDLLLETPIEPLQQNIMDMLRRMANTAYEDMLARLLLIRLENESAEVRARTATGLGEIRSKQAVGKLVALLADETPSVRRSAAIALGQIGSNQAVDALIARLGDDRMRTIAAQALGSSKSERTVNVLLIHLNDESSTMRISVTLALEQIASERTVDGLLARLRDNQETDTVHFRAAEALGRIGTERAMGGLLTCLDYEALKAYYWIANALVTNANQQVVDGLLRRTEHENVIVRTRAAELLGRIGNDRAVDSLLARLEDLHETDAVRVKAAEALGQIGGEHAVDGLLACLSDVSDKVRVSVINALGQTGSTRAVDSLLTCLEDDSISVRSKAVAALGQIGNERALDGVLAALGDRNWQVRNAAAESLGRIKNERAVNGLQSLLDDRSKRVRATAATALGGTVDEREIDNLLARLTDSKTEERVEIASVLGKIGSLKAVQGLLSCLEDSSAAVRKQAAQSLGKIKSGEVIDSLLNCLDDESAGVRAGAAAALGEIGSTQAEDGLLARLEDESEDVQAWAAWALAEIKSQRAVDRLIPWLSQTSHQRIAGRRHRRCDWAYTTILEILAYHTPDSGEALVEHTNKKVISGPWNDE